MAKKQKASEAPTITLGKNVYNAIWLRSVSEDKAIRTLTRGKKGKPITQVRNAWKQANGKSVRNHESEAE